jgi:clan AA aspartic protease
MITGTVTPFREARISLRVRGPGGQEVILDAVIDTGFNRYLTLPPSLISTLGLSFEAPAQATLADGSIVWMNYYRAAVSWEGNDRQIPVLESDGGPLVGMALLYGHELRIQVVDGGLVSIDALP